MRQVRIGSGAGYSGDRIEPALDLAERGELDGIIEPANTRVAIAKALRALRGKRAELPPKKHGNIPL